jgi:hypothetical protein
VGNVTDTVADTVADVVLDTIDNVTVQMLGNFTNDDGRDVDDASSSSGGMGTHATGRTTVLVVGIASVVVYGVGRLW